MAILKFKIKKKTLVWSVLFPSTSFFPPAGPLSLLYQSPFYFHETNPTPAFLLFFGKNYFSSAKFLQNFQGLFSYPEVFFLNVTGNLTSVSFLKLDKAFLFSNFLVPSSSFALSQGIKATQWGVVLLYKKKKKVKFR